MVLASVLLAGAGAVVLAVSIYGARYPTIHPAEMRVFRAFNRLPGFLYWILWLPMQLGNLVVGCVVGVLVAVWKGDLGIGVAVVGATIVKLVVERIVRREMAPYLTVRQRPGTSEPGAILRGGDVPKSGMSFPSGHVILVAGISGLLAMSLEWQYAWIPWLCTALVMLGRMYVGAHNPLDVTAGLGAGLLIGGGLLFVVAWL
jgi:membrane-associated phospholipid phosphatase